MTTTRLPVHLVDISHHQDYRIDYAAAREAGVRGVMHKATEGTSYVDPNYRERRRKAGLPFGAYHFARPSVGDAAAEARHFLDVAKPKRGDLLPALDLETTEGLSLAQLRTWAKQWTGIVREALDGHDPIVYSPYDLQLPGLRWRPRYNDDNRPPELPYDVWQFSNGTLGVPSRVPGFPGATDLNTLAKGVSFSDLVWAVNTPPKRTRRLRMAVLPGQFSDSNPAARADFRTVFARGYDVIFGTETGQPDHQNIMKEEGKAAGYLIASGPGARYDTWVGVRQDLVVKGSWKTGVEHAIDNSGSYHPHPPGRWGDKDIVWGQCEIEGLGVCSFGAVHPLTYGGAGLALKRETDIQHAEACARFVREHGKGSALAFIGGDWNLVDKKYDWTQGKWKGVSCWDDVKEWDNTGHGNIDGVLRSVNDRRVLRFVSAEALDDQDLPLATDHFLTECVVQIELLPA